MFGNLSSFDGSLFDEFRRIQQEMDRAFTTGPMASGIRSVAQGTFPPINVGSTADQVDVYLFAAGLDAKSLDISIQQNLLTIDGERPAKSEEPAEGYYRKELFSGAFHRVINLPEDVDPEKVDASYVDGVLRISVQRRESAKPRQIEVK
ncbi:MAG: Hsp20/alpha crystallin family protein [Candidatus Thiodiazotropha taylori]|nr:Hsp20/alpha crystallin family protein [Candidatus Thiodiazotropha taylori]MCG7911208.1 Hsp20/alpha crystallin family protein [Candidatus Thiodiazotropha taylori]MCG8068144.1 Hsp20/alpha crystallin family protein [Candidatus Thiodiazotropha taylori]